MGLIDLIQIRTTMDVIAFALGVFFAGVFIFALLMMGFETINDWLDN